MRVYIILEVLTYYSTNIVSKEKHIGTTTLHNTGCFSWHNILPFFLACYRFFLNLTILNKRVFFYFYCLVFFYKSPPQNRSDWKCALSLLSGGQCHWRESTGPARTSRPSGTSLLHHYIDWSRLVFINYWKSFPLMSKTCRCWPWCRTD